MKHNISYACDKCGNTSYEEGNMRVTGGFLTKILNVQKG
ncbi:MAG: zinc ribbon domain-containing protein [Dehalococcoidia bacterium]